MHDVMGQTRGQRIARVVVGVAGVALPYLYVRWINHSSQVFSDAAKGWLIATAAVFTAACAAFAYHFLIEGPYQLYRETQQTPERDYLADELARRKAEVVADAIMPRRSAEPRFRDDGFRKHLEHLAAESAKRCPELPIWEAVEYVRQVIGDDDFQNCYPEARRQMRQAALEDRLEIWGRKEIPPITLSTPLGGSGAWSRIEPSYWAEHELNSLAIGQLFQEREHTWEEAFKNKIGHRYWELKVRRAQIERLWSVKQPPGGPDRSAVISSGRDLVQRYRNEGMPEPFGTYLAKQRAYLDIKPHLGATYLQEKARRADMPDTPTKRDWDSGELERELARLERDWKL